MRRTTSAILLAAGLALAGCSSPSDGGGEPTPSATSSAPVRQSRADLLAACTDAIAAGEDSGVVECEGLSADDYLEALRAANERGRGVLGSAVASASAAQ